MILASSSVVNSSMASNSSRIFPLKGPARSFTQHLIGFAQFTNNLLKRMLFFLEFVLLAREGNRGLKISGSLPGG